MSTCVALADIFDQSEDVLRLNAPAQRAGTILHTAITPEQTTAVNPRKICGLVFKS